MSNKKAKVYEVVNDFKDSQDENHVYQKGESYPHKKAEKPTEKRIAELISKENKIGKPVIKERA